MSIIAIYKCGNGFSWNDCPDEFEIQEARESGFFADDMKANGVHVSVKSALYDDMDYFVDMVQGENALNEDELYVVTYYEHEEYCSGLLGKVDLGITKSEIIENVKNQRYVEGAHYFTMGNVFLTTRMMIEELVAEGENKEEEDANSFDYYEIEFGIRSDLNKCISSDVDYIPPSGACMCIKARTWGTQDMVESWLEKDMHDFGCDCVYSITKITEDEALSCYGFDGNEPIWG